MKSRQTIVFVGNDSTSNSLGRAYCLWLLAEAAGYRSETIVAAGGHIWPPLADTPFAASIRTATQGSFGISTAPDAIVCVKPLPASLRLARSIAREFDAPMILDIDDPDIEAGLSDGSVVKRLAKTFLRPVDTWWFLWARRNARAMTTIVSNGYLFDRYGGVVIPHVRHRAPVGRDPIREPGVIAFVGTARGHKGVDVLRSAVEVSGKYRLLITANAPDDAMEHEEWVGPSTLEQGLDLVADSDVVVIPSRDTPFSRGQLPAKLIDAMMLGRPVAASDLPAIRWALGEGGVYFEPGSSDSLGRALDTLRDVRLRRRLGDENRQRAEKMFTVEANVENFVSAIESVKRE